MCKNLVQLIHSNPATLLKDRQSGKNANKTIKQLNYFFTKLNVFHEEERVLLFIGLRIIWFGCGYTGDS